MLATLFTLAITLLVQAFALQFAVNLVVSPAQPNPYERALKVCAGLTAASLLLGLIPFFGPLLYLGVWIVTIATVYELGFMKSAIIGVVQLVLQKLALLLLGLIGLAPSCLCLS